MNTACDDSKENNNTDPNSHYLELNEQSEPLKTIDDLLIGRDSLKQRITQSIVESVKTGGAFLVGGYRGVGKTRLIAEVTADKRFNNLKKIKIDLGSEQDLTARDLLCDIAESLYNRQNFWEKLFRLEGRVAAYILTAVLPAAAYILFCVESAPISMKEIKMLIGCIFFGATLTLILKINFNLFLKKCIKIDRIIRKTRYSQSRTNNASTTALKLIQIGGSHTTKEEPISARRLQQELMDYFGLFDRKVKYIIVFDEVDKINTSRSNITKKQHVDELIGALKALLSNSSCIYIFIAGRDMIDAYHSESGYTSVLYESVFKEIFYVPSLISNFDDVSAITNTDQRNPKGDSIENYLSTIINTDKLSNEQKYLYLIFKKYLCLHTWGNPKSMSLLIKEHIHWAINPKYEKKPILFTILNYILFFGKKKKHLPRLIFSKNDIARIHTSAKLYSLFESSVGDIKHYQDDKTLISILVTIFDIVRYHNQGFTRAMLERSVAGIDVHSEINLSNVTEDFIYSALEPLIRTTENNIFPFRFYTTIDIELTNLYKSVGRKAAAFEFALDTSEPVRAYYEAELKSMITNKSEVSYVAIAKTQMILGEIYQAEHRYDKAHIWMTNAVANLKDILRNSDGTWRHGGGVSIEGQYLLIQALLKKGLLEEIRDNYRLARRLYREAFTIARYAFEVHDPQITDRSSSTKNIIISSIDNYMRWMTKDNHHSDTGLNSNRRRSSIAHALLSLDFLAIKSQRTPISVFYGKIKHFNFNKTDPKLYTKVLLLNFYGCNYGSSAETAFLAYYKKFSDLYEPKNRKEQKNLIDSSYVAYAFGHIELSRLANKTKTDIEEILDKKQELFEIKESKVHESWLEKLETLQQFDPDISKPDTRKPNELETLKSSLFLIYQGAKLTLKRGRHIESAHQMLSVLTIWISFLESIPWKDIVDFTDHNRKRLENIGRPVWFEKVITHIQSAIEKSDNAAFLKDRMSIIGDTSRGVGNHSLSEALRLSEIIKPANYSSESDHHQIHVWHRSNLSNYTLIFCLWEDYCRQSIKRWIGTNNQPKPLIHYFPSPIGNLPRVTAIYEWINGRIEAHSLRKKMDSISDFESNIIEIKKYNKSKPEEKEAFITHCEKYISITNNLAMENLAECIRLFSKSLNDTKRAFKSENPDTFPPKSSVYFNMLETVSFCKGSDRIINGARNLLSDEDRIFLDLQYLKNQVKRHALDLHAIDDITSAAFQRKIRHKYYLYDDLEDSFYIAEWSFVRMTSSACKLHLQGLGVEHNDN